MTTPAWDALVQSALLGSARAATPAPSAPPAAAMLLDTLDAVDDVSPERRLLRRAAVLGAYVRAGQLPPSLATPLDEPAPVDADDAPMTSSAATTLLSSMLLGNERDLLPEWLDRAATAGWRAPAVLLPALLDLARGNRALRPGVASVLGARGRWLVARNPDWSWATGASDVTAIETWETGTPADRTVAFGLLRRADPVDARARLEATWRTESAATRAALIAILEPGLGPEDEPLLERSLDDRSREVRAAAAGALASLPTSALVTRMTARARPLLRYEPGRLLRRARLDVTLPGPPDTMALRDGIQPTPPGNIGERAWWLSQIVAAVPPRTWTDAWNVSAERLVELARESDWAAPLADGWGRAAFRYRDGAWAEALLRANVLVDQHTRVAPARTQLFGALSPERREALLEDAFTGRAPIDPGEMLSGATHPWSARFARATLAWLRRRAAADASQTPAARGIEDWRAISALNFVALKLPIGLAGEATTNWPAELSASWAPAIERYLSMLTTRRTLDAAFTTR